MLAGPVITSGRDLPGEAMAEMVDARTYLVWEAQLALDEMDADPSSSTAAQRYSAAMTGLTGLLTAYIACAAAPRRGVTLTDSELAQRIASGR